MSIPAFSALMRIKIWNVAKSLHSPTVTPEVVNFPPNQRLAALRDCACMSEIGEWFKQIYAHCSKVAGKKLGKWIYTRWLNCKLQEREWKRGGSSNFCEGAFNATALVEGLSTKLKNLRQWSSRLVAGIPRTNRFCKDENWKIWDQPRFPQCTTTLRVSLAYIGLTKIVPPGHRTLTCQVSIPLTPIRFQGSRTSKSCK